MRNTVYLPFQGSRVRKPLGESRLRELAWNSSVSCVVSLPRYISATTCRRLLDLSSCYPATPGRMFEGSKGRRNRIRVLDFGSETRWAYDLVARIFARANRQFGFHLVGLAEPIHTIEYGPEDFIDWHSDCTREETSTRKLTATVLLTPPSRFTGGAIEFAAASSHPARCGLGEATVFPAFLPHRVRPVAQGNRVVLAAWAHGPAFR